MADEPLDYVTPVHVTSFGRSARIWPKIFLRCVARFATRALLGDASNGTSAQANTAARGSRVMSTLDRCAGRSPTPSRIVAEFRSIFRARLRRTFSRQQLRCELEWRTLVAVVRLRRPTATRRCVNFRVRPRPLRRCCVRTTSCRINEEMLCNARHGP
jgi:hypothetical protein